MDLAEKLTASSQLLDSRIQLQILSGELNLTSWRTGFMNPPVSRSPSIDLPNLGQDPEDFPGFAGGNFNFLRII